MKRTVWRLALIVWIPIAFAGWMVTTWISWPVCLVAWIIRGRVPRWAHSNTIVVLWLGTLDWILDHIVTESAPPLGQQ